MRWALVVAMAALAACRGGSTQLEGSDTLEVAADSIDWRVADLPAFPEFPRRRSGQYVAQAVGVTDFHSSWRARVARCADPARLLLVAGSEQGGGSILLELPGPDSLVGSYPVRAVDARDVPAAPAANVGFQFFEEYGASAYQASAGSVEVLTFDERISGRVQVELVHIQTTERARVAGIFHEIRVQDAPRSECARAGEVADTLASSDQ